MNTDLTPRAKILIMVSAIVSFLVVAPIFWGLVVLLALQVYQAPWPAIAVICTSGVLWSSWLILSERINSTMLGVADVVVPILLFLSLIGTVSHTPIVAYEWSTLIYIVALIEVGIHSVLTMSVALGLTIAASNQAEAEGVIP